MLAALIGHTGQTIAQIPTRRQTMTCKRVFQFAIAILLFTTSWMASAQGTEWPQKPIRIIVPFTAGGIADVMARSVGHLMSQSMGQPVIIENRPGANMNIAGDYVAKSAPDGYTVCMCSTILESVNPFLYAPMSFDPQKDLMPVAAIGRFRLHLVVRPGLPVSNIKEFVEFARSRKVPLTFGSVGVGSTPHIMGEMFKRSAGFDAVHVPYKGGPPVIQDLLASNLDFYLDGGLSFPFVREGKIKMLAVASAQRSPQFPGMPTLAESGYQGMDFDSWFNFYVPAGTPADRIRRINREVSLALANEPLRQRFLEFGAEAKAMSPEEVKAYAERERQAFGRVIKDNGIRAE